MSRIPAIDPKTAEGPARELLDAVQSALGVTPNLFRVLAQSPKALEGFLGLYGAAAGFALDKATQERIALTVAQGNRCDYCLAAHTAIGRGAGLSNDEMRLNRQGASGDAYAAAIVAFARAVNDKVGGVSDSDLGAARAAGLGNRELVEIIATVAINVFTNLLNKVAATDIDFPRAAPLAELRAAA